MARDYWLRCTFCQHSWIGEPYRNDGYEEKCPECNLEDFEVVGEYRSKYPSLPVWVVLLIPNLLLTLY